MIFDLVPVPLRVSALAEHTRSLLKAADEAEDRGDKICTEYEVQKIISHRNQMHKIDK